MVDVWLGGAVHRFPVENVQGAYAALTTLGYQGITVSEWYVHNDRNQISKYGFLLVVGKETEYWVGPSLYLDDFCKGFVAVYNLLKIPLYYKLFDHDVQKYLSQEILSFQVRQLREGPRFVVQPPVTTVLPNELFDVIHSFSDPVTQLQLQRVKKGVNVTKIAKTYQQLFHEHRYQEIVDIAVKNNDVAMLKTVYPYMGTFDFGITACKFRRNASIELLRLYCDKIPMRKIMGVSSQAIRFPLDLFIFVNSLAEYAKIFLTTIDAQYYSTYRIELRCATVQNREVYWYLRKHVSEHDMTDADVLAGGDLTVEKDTKSLENLADLALYGRNRSVLEQYPVDFPFDVHFKSHVVLGGGFHLGTNLNPIKTANSMMDDVEFFKWFVNRFTNFDMLRLLDVLAKNITFNSFRYLMEAYPQSVDAKNTLMTTASTNFSNSSLIIDYLVAQGIQVNVKITRGAIHPKTLMCVLKYIKLQDIPSQDLVHLSKEIFSSDKSDVRAKIYRELHRRGVNPFRAVDKDDIIEEMTHYNLIEMLDESLSKIVSIGKTIVRIVLSSLGPKLLIKYKKHIRSGHAKLLFAMATGDVATVEKYVDKFIKTMDGYEFDLLKRYRYPDILKIFERYP
jgi:hypothetical protein